VFATITGVKESEVACLLENGLTALVPKTSIVPEGSNQSLSDLLETGMVIQGRVDKLTFADDCQLELNC